MHYVVKIFSFISDMKHISTKSFNLSKLIHLLLLNSLSLSKYTLSDFITHFKKCNSTSYLFLNISHYINHTKLLSYHNLIRFFLQNNDTFWQKSQILVTPKNILFQDTFCLIFPYGMS